MNISYEYYHTFYYAAKYKNLTQAAEIMHSNQPNVSRTIKLLEHALGCSLLIRSNRGIKLTPEGERLYAHVRIAVEQLCAAEEELTMSARHEGLVTIGVSETALHLVLLPTLNKFKRDYPKTRIRITSYLTNQAIEAVQNGLVDFAVVTMPAGIKKPLRSIPIMEYSDILLGGTAYSFLSDKPVPLRALTQYPLVCLGENTITYQFYSDFYRSCHLTLKPEMETASTDQLLPIIKNNLGLGFVPELLAQDAIKKREVCPVSLMEQIPRRRIGFIENESRPLSSAANKLKTLLCKSAPPAV